jgi:hypothetical protein
MFDFMRKFGFARTSGVRVPSDAIRRALEADGLPSGIVASALRVVESPGRYSGRKVTYIRVFDSARAAGRGLDVRAFGDLEAYPDLVLRAGHVEQDGAVVVSWRAPSADAATPARERADRAAHGGDERFVFPERFDFPVKDRR